MEICLARQKVIIGKIVTLLEQPDRVPPLIQKFGIVNVLDFLDWAYDTMKFIVAAEQFIETCIQINSSSLITEMEFENALRFWRRGENPGIDREIVTGCISEIHNVEQSDGVWNGLALVPPRKWKPVEPIPRVDPRRFRSDDSTGFSSEEVRFLTWVANRRRINFSSRGNGPGNISVLPTGETQNKAGVNVSAPPGIAVNVTPHDILGTQQAMGEIIRKGTTHLKSYLSSLENLFVLDEVLVRNKSLSEALDDLSIIDCDRSRVDINEIRRVVREIRANGGSKPNGKSKPIGNTMVFIENKVRGMNICEAIKIVQDSGLCTSSRSTFFRLDDFLVAEFLRPSTETTSRPFTGR